MTVARRVAVLLAAILVGVALYPRRVAVAPAVALLVRYPAGEPAPGVLVKQEWRYLAPGVESHAATLRADETGHVIFPERYARVSFAQEVAQAALNIESVGHDGLGPRAMVWAYGADPTVWTFVYCSVRDQRPNEIVLKAGNVPIYVRP